MYLTKRAYYFGIVFTAFVLFASACTKKEVTVYQAPKPDTQVVADTAPTAAPAAPIQWKAPDSWKGGQPNQMRLASFEVPGSGDASIVMLGAGAGDLTANINRWRGQVGLGELTDSAVASQMKTVSTGIGKAKWIRIVDPKKPEKGILGMIAPFGASIIFVKLAAPIKTLDAEQANFLALVGSLQPNQAK